MDWPECSGGILLVLILIRRLLLHFLFIVCLPPCLVQTLDQAQVWAQQMVCFLLSCSWPSTICLEDCVYKWSDGQAAQEQVWLVSCVARSLLEILEVVKPL